MPDNTRPRPPQCPSCAFHEPYNAMLAYRPVTLYRCAQGVPGHPDRHDCKAYQRAPGADDA